MDEDYVAIFTVGDRYIVLDNHYEDTSGLYRATNSNLCVTDIAHKTSYMERLAGLKNSQCDIMLAQTTQELEHRKQREVRKLHHQTSNIQQEYRVMKIGIQKNAIEEKKRKNPTLDTNFEERVLQKAIKFLQSDTRNPCYLDSSLRYPLRAVTKVKEDHVTATVVKARRALQEMELEHHIKNPSPRLVKTERNEKDAVGCIHNTSSTQGTQNTLVIHHDNSSPIEGHSETMTIPVINNKQGADTCSIVNLNDDVNATEAKGNASLEEKHRQHGLTTSDEIEVHQNITPADEWEEIHTNIKAEDIGDMIVPADHMGPLIGEFKGPTEYICPLVDDLELGADYKTNQALHGENRESPNKLQNDYHDSRLGTHKIDHVKNLHSHNSEMEVPVGQTREILMIKQRMMKRATDKQRNPDNNDTASVETKEEPLADLTPYKILLTNNGAQMNYNMNQIFSARKPLHSSPRPTGTSELSTSVQSETYTPPQTDSNSMKPPKSSFTVRESQNVLPAIIIGDCAKSVQDWKPARETEDKETQQEAKGKLKSANNLTDNCDFKYKTDNAAFQSSDHESQSSKVQGSPNFCLTSQDNNPISQAAGGQYLRNPIYSQNQKEHFLDRESEPTNTHVLNEYQKPTVEGEKEDFNLGDNTHPASIRLKGRSLTSIAPPSQLQPNLHASLSRSKSVMFKTKQHRGNRKQPITQEYLKKERVKLEEKMNKFFSSMNKVQPTGKKAPLRLIDEDTSKTKVSGNDQPSSTNKTKKKSEAHSQNGKRYVKDIAKEGDKESVSTLPLTTMNFPRVSRDIQGQPGRSPSGSLSSSSMVPRSGSTSLPALGGRRSSVGLPYHSAIRSNRHSATFKLQRAVAKMKTHSSTSQLLECQAIREQSLNLMENIPESQEDGSDKMENILESQEHCPI